jgi:FtsZ-binding cell division protein ZapB
MNTIGKILVILNFLFAVIVGLLLVVDFAKRNQWREAYLALEKKTETVVKVSDVDKTAMKNVAGDYQKARDDLEKLSQQFKAAETLLQLKLDELTEEKKKLQNELSNATTTNEQLLQTQKRHVLEIAHLNGVIKDRESAIVRFEADIKRFRNDAVQFEALAKTRQIQNENLLEQVRNLTVSLAKAQAGVGGGDAVGAVRDPNSPNPPAVVVNGKIEKVDGGDLVVLSLGTDHGIANGNTLDVYRTQPQPKYLGMVRIINADHHNSVARLIATGNAQFRAKLQEGDLVTSKLLK